MNKHRPSSLLRLLHLVLLVAAAAAGWLSIQTPTHTAEAVGTIRDFITRYSTTTKGNITLIGNTVVTCPDTAPTCAAARSASTSTTDQQNNVFNMIYVDVDTDATTFNSSEAILTLPAGSEVLFAGLYWGGDSSGGVGGSGAPNPAIRNQVKFRTPVIPVTDPYTIVTAANLDASTAVGDDYQGWANVTTLLQAVETATGSANGTYTVADLQVGTGNDMDGGWALIVVYQNDAEIWRNLNVFDGFASLDNDTPGTSLDVPISGFVTPHTGAFSTFVGVVGYEGDRLFNEFSEFDTDFTADPPPFQLTDALHPLDDNFNSTIGLNGINFAAKNPNYVNQLGFDASILDISGNPNITNGDTQAEIRLEVYPTDTNDITAEDYYLGAVLFVVDSDEPELGLAKRVASVIPTGNGSYTVTYTILLDNLGGVPISNVQVTDDLSLTFDGATSFVVNSVSTSANLTPNTSYTGTPPNTNLLAGTDTLAAGETGTISLVVVVTPGQKVCPYLNVASGTGLDPLGNIIRDDSQDGDDVDPDGNDDPTDNNDPTRLCFQIIEGTETPTPTLTPEGTPVTPPPVITPISPFFDPSISKIGSLEPGGLGLPGERLTWVLTVSNYGVVRGTDIVVTDEVQAELRVDGADVDRGTVTISGQRVTFNIPYLDPGESIRGRIYTTVLSAPDSGEFVNDVEGQGGDGRQFSGEGRVPVARGLPATGYPPAEDKRSLLDWVPWVALSGLLVILGVWWVFRQDRAPGH